MGNGTYPQLSSLGSKNVRGLLAHLAIMKDSIVALKKISEISPGYVILVFLSLLISSGYNINFVTHELVGNGF